MIVQVLSSSLDLGSEPKSASFTNTTSVFILQWERGEGWWRHEIRVEAILTPQTNQIYPVCVGGKGVCPPEDCGGPWGFMEKRQYYSVWHLLERFSSMLERENGSSPLTKSYNLCCERVRDSAASAFTGYKLRKLPTNLTLFVGGESVE